MLESLTEGLPMSQYISRKQHRLPSFTYRGTFRYSITSCTFQKRPLFTKRSVVEMVLAHLKRESESCFLVWAYCFMPDHLHLLLEGTGEQSGLVRFVKIFKQKSGFDYSKSCGGSLWQKSYYERVLRKGEETREVAMYIWNNPVRKGLVKDYREYPFSGSFVLNMTNNADIG
jgi:putative transposase